VVAEARDDIGVQKEEDVSVVGGTALSLMSSQ
jgi:hypothetical protein